MKSQALSENMGPSMMSGLMGNKTPKWRTHPETNSSHLKNWMVGILVSFWEGLFSGANCLFQGG